MEELKKEEIIRHCEEINEYIDENGLTPASFAKDLSPIISNNRMWFISKRNSLTIGSLDDEEIILYKERGMDFGVPLLLWDDWLMYMKSFLNDHNCDYVGTSIELDNGIKLGRWVNRQRKNYWKLDEDRQYSLISAGLRINERIYKRNIGNKFSYDSIHYDIDDFVKKYDLDKEKVKRRLLLGWDIETIKKKSRLSRISSLQNIVEDDTVEFEQMSLITYDYDYVNSNKAKEDDFIIQTNKVVRDALTEVNRAGKRIRILIDENKELQKQLDKLGSQNKELIERTALLQKRLDSTQKLLNIANEKIAEQKGNSEPRGSHLINIEEYLNSKIEFMRHSAIKYGISIQKIYIRVRKDAVSYQVNILGEISLLADQIHRVGCNIKAVIYDADGNILIDGSKYIPRDFSGFDVLDIGWRGGREEVWRRVSKILLFVA